MHGLIQQSLLLGGGVAVKEEALAHGLWHPNIWAFHLLDYPCSTKLFE
jgi:hypothetical protein